MDSLTSEGRAASKSGGYAQCATTQSASAEHRFLAWPDQAPCEGAPSDVQ